MFSVDQGVAGSRVGEVKTSVLGIVQKTGKARERSVLVGGSQAPALSRPSSPTSFPLPLSAHTAFLLLPEHVW